MSETANEREVMEYDIIIVGAGPAGLACAIRLKQLKPDMMVAVIEKGAEMLVSACPACKLAFVDGVREFKHDIEVYDIHELIAKRFGVLD